MPSSEESLISETGNSDNVMNRREVPVFPSDQSVDWDELFYEEDEILIKLDASRNVLKPKSVEKISGLKRVKET